MTKHLTILKILSWGVALGMLFGGCGVPKKMTGGPAEAAIAYQHALERGDTQGVLELSHTELRRQIENDAGQTDAFPKLVKDTEKAIQERGGYRLVEVHTETLIDADTATVELELFYGDGHSLKMRVFMMKEDGYWKFVRFEKL